MPTYEAIYGHDLSQYGDIQIEAPDDEAALRFAKAIYFGNRAPGDEGTDEISWRSTSDDDCPTNPRIVALDRVNDKGLVVDTVAEGIDLEEQPDAALTPLRRVQACRLAVERLKDARDGLRAAGAKRAADAVAKALKSAEGALRHAQSVEAAGTAAGDLAAAAGATP